MSTNVDWAKEYDGFKNYVFQPGDILTTYDGSPARLNIVLKKGQPPFIHGIVYLPQIVGHELGWWLHGIDSNSMFGMKCIIMPKCRTEVMDRFGVGCDTVPVKSLRVVKYSQSGEGLLCEVHEWGGEEPAVVEEPVAVEEAVTV